MNIINFQKTNLHARTQTYTAVQKFGTIFYFFILIYTKLLLVSYAHQSFIYLIKKIQKIRNIVKHYCNLK